MWNARCRFGCLWLSQVARVMADNCLRIFVVVQLAGVGDAERESAWHLLTALQMLPAVFLSPLNGAISNSLPKRWVLLAAAVYCAGVVATLGLTQQHWEIGWALLAVGTSVYGPTRYALLPAAAQDARLPLTRVNGLIEMGSVTAIVAGMTMGWFLGDEIAHGLPAAVGIAIALNGLSVLAAVPVRFPSDVRRADAAAQAIAGFFRDTRKILADRVARSSMLALACLRGVIAAMTGALVAVTLSGELKLSDELIKVGAWIMVGVATGSLLAGVQRHPRRALGLVPIGCVGLLVGLFLAAIGSVPSWPICVLVGAMGGLVNVPLAATYQASLPADARGNGMAVRNLCDYVLMTAMSLLMFALARWEIVAARGQLWLLAGLAAALAAVSWRALYLHCLEQVFEWLIWPMYRIRGRGPGLEHFPLRGPVLVLANHSAWFDPFWIGKVVPRRIIPMMTSVFYDLPVLRWLMRHVVRAIRVQAALFRRDVPELAEAVAALDRGECVVIFPEGAMRRRDEQPLRQFGQGVWHILKDRPATPVVVCWIEGGWGSFFSYRNGPPTKNKRVDFWRRIDIAVTVPQVLHLDALTDHRTTRAYLMRACAGARRHLGLASLSLSTRDDEEAERTDEPAQI